MSKLVLKTEIDAPPGVVWQTLRNFAATTNWHPFVEQRYTCDDAARVMVCSLTESPLPIEECSIEIRVTDNGAGASSISWTGVFSTSSEHEMAAVKELHRILHGRITQLEAMLGGTNKG
ncbi:SRPBCC family protein [Sedimenticola hydrogenitrophicus]|uniref:SRPBCC family protein n=1 Tax=Sedimenticola hydrogenitrophicus TaxID=2967975 RepID=UPI0023B1AB3B|nr:SRPBCC family protein [Sedimenticola hydrogenitrophicus]